MSAGPEIVERRPAVVGTSNGNGSTRGDGAGVIKRGIDLLPRPELSKSIALTKTCPTCEGPLPQGKALPYLVTLGFLTDSHNRAKVRTGHRLHPGPLTSDTFDLETEPAG